MLLKMTITELIANIKRLTVQQAEFEAQGDVKRAGMCADSIDGYREWLGVMLADLDN
jgi:hypothetical protein